MNIALNFFPKINENMLNRIGYQATQYEFSYIHDGDVQLLETNFLDNKGDSIGFTDPRHEWVPEDHNLIIRRTYTINMLNFLFGPKGVANNKAEVGIGIIWSSKSSNNRGTKKIATFSKDKASPVTFNSELTFFPGELRESINIQTVIFISSPGVPLPGEEHIGNEPGIILGILDNYNIIIEGNGSVFPIVEVNQSSMPLWWVSCDWTDPQEDSFDEENVRICLNRAHPHFKILNYENGLKDSPMLFDIVASAIQIIIQKVKESDSWNEIIQGQNLLPGSVGEAVKYFIDTFDWETNSPDQLALTIRKDLESRI
ncbi:hypothetical protein MM300_20280 [Evansella sp. LMS18]|uniref:hypothetical protein n=1 Tax=Evansella sp. LMS18 TaxID=2924033 RepID=UPI0020D1F18B|nr:hypothetical protein [Evansella sp. LMS18]UTR10187.1 hypothetical protein MM300_20280 [Evansella sp. LMS18]